MNRRKFLALVAAALASPALAQLAPVSTEPITPGAWREVTFSMTDTALPISWGDDYREAARQLAADIDRRCEEWAYENIYGVPAANESACVIGADETLQQVMR